MRIIISFLLLPLTVHASEPVKRTIFDKEVIEAVIQAESSYQSGAVGDDGRAVGCLQIWKIMVREANRISGYRRFTYNDRKSKRKSIEMFLLYQKHHNPTGDIEKGCRIWVGGPDGWKQDGTKEYYKKVAKILADNKIN
ncbi:MAG: hypothetical protein R3243_16405 [Arenibacter latericius]|nr:hypothetical protein [Arenibacter latericius]